MSIINARDSLEAVQTLSSRQEQHIEGLPISPGEPARGLRSHVEDGTCRCLTEGTLQGFGILSASGRILHADHHLGRLIGTGSECLIGTDLAEYLPEQAVESMLDWLHQTDRWPVRASHRLATRNGHDRHLHFSIDKLSRDTDQGISSDQGIGAALSLVVTDLDQHIDRKLLSAEIQAINAVDASLCQARTEALSLLENAIAANSRADAMQDELQREIINRKQLENALHDAQQRCERILKAIGNVHGLSTTDWQTILSIDPPK